MATHSSIPAWKIPWAEEPGGLQSMAKSWTQLEHVYILHYKIKTLKINKYGDPTWVSCQVLRLLKQGWYLAGLY